MPIQYCHHIVAYNIVKAARAKDEHGTRFYTFIADVYFAMSSGSM